MNATTTNRFARTFAPDVEGSIRFVTPLVEAGMREVHGQSFEIEITSKTTCGDNVGRYWVQTVRPVGKRMERVLFFKQLPAGDAHEAEQYTVDCTFGSDLGSWQCNCKDFLARGRRRKVPHCRHSKAARKVCVMFGIYKGKDQ